MASRHPRPQRLWLLAPLALCVLLHHQSAALTLCGSQLVDALAFVCNGRGFYAAPPAGVQRQRQQLGGITEACCLRACSLLVLERYCAQPQLLPASGVGGHAAAACLASAAAGTLWNLSCHESLRAALVELCLPALVEHVLVPESGWRSNFGDSPASPSPPGSSASPSAAFCNALTCLRVADPAGEPEPTAPPPTAPPPTAPPPTAAALAAAAPTAPPAAAMSPRELHQLRDELRDLQRELGGATPRPDQEPPEQIAAGAAAGRGTGRTSWL
ncbi:sterile alpha motif domain-containing protein 1-like [Lethenteron reissneri]|uniref:sterile alpha motif domain-containing protein 1-like n=1 Tax=Lethenteron reissneri TaxID=7753 RepID=UPI002AB668FF|nr:sterile alpha motif domain-containing protein 1-like [Lethenteron reissneri]